MTGNRATGLTGPDPSAPLSEGATALLLAQAVRKHGQVLTITRSAGRAGRLAQAVRALAPAVEVLHLPPWDCQPGDGAAPSRGIVGQRAAVLATLAQQPAAPTGRLVLASAAAALQALPPPDAWDDACLTLRVGAALDEIALRAWLDQAGYFSDGRVDEVGEFALRAATLDVHPGAATLPCRLDLAEGRIQAIRRYDPVTQRSRLEVDSVTLAPVSEPPFSPAQRAQLAERLAEQGMARERAEEVVAIARDRGSLSALFPLLHQPVASLPDLLPGAFVVRDAGAEGALAEAAAQAAEVLELELGPAVRDALRPLRHAARRLLTLPLDLLEAALAAHPGLALAEGTAADAAPRLASIPAAVRRAAQLAAQGCRVILAAGDPGAAPRVARAAAAAGLAPATVLDSWPADDALAPGAVAVLPLALAEGFDLPGWAVIAQGSATSAEEVGTPHGLLVQTDLAEGDRAVHLDHGIGIVRGLEAACETLPEDSLVLEYAGGDRLLVPASELDRVWRHGSADSGRAPDRLHGSGWEDRRAELEADVDKVARRLVREARARARADAAVLQPPRPAMARLARSFKFEPTAGQRAAIEATLRDLEAGRPMDRLVVGDVGYGKTEVAIRATGAAALAGAQVAILAPTTVLARQHLASFRARLAPLGLTVAGLTGRDGRADADAVRQGLADGTVDVVVGTHALFAKGLQFARLALVVIDEEQRFGARHKAALAALRRGRHVLTLSATPIPRTLQGALAGLRDLSIIDTPPARRRPVRTLIVEEGPAILAEALGRELRRGGQSFVICPRIEDLDEVEAAVRHAVPEARVVQAHGRLGKALDDAILAFAQGDADVLVATAIVESGIDIPRANTMLVHRPELFGLAQLHQLRGRVGRGAAQAFCYLLTRPGEPLGEVAAKRLQALEVIESLGGGFAIAALDMELRGAGVLFGEEQSGHASEVGTELLQDLLSRAVRRLRGEQIADWRPELVLGLRQTIPLDYVPEAELRIGLHRRLARCRGEAELDDLRAEIEDRFGSAPDAVETLLDVARVRVRARTLGVAELVLGPAATALAPPQRTAQALADLAARLDQGATISGERVLLRECPPPDALAHANALLDRIAAAPAPRRSRPRSRKPQPEAVAA
ncbi:DEAD/DEAH box helicase [Zavarzinia sp. CC-PAN008]|uniref:DEAD/DEAH box helicase n=1 Tax=Zavarzinia sp. CC-PAN008 TaxID=3243332 RepID=UPI003F74A8E3